MSKYTIEFRYIADYDLHTPLMHIPKERTTIEAESITDARRNFFQLDMIVNTLKGSSGHFTIEDIWEGG